MTRTTDSTGPEAQAAAGGDRSHRDADFSRAVLEDLYRYPRKRGLVARILWVVTGLFGGHRFYLDRIGTGLLMLFTVGGAGVWWLVDGFLLGRMLREYNDDQMSREAAGMAPRQLEFMPPLRGGYRMPPYPEWVGKRSGRLRMVGDVLILMFFGSALGASAARDGQFEPIIAVLALIAITIFGARWQALAHTPILRAFDRWNHRLRLFYFHTDPGGPLKLAFRPIFGIITAPFKRTARAEVRLYLQLGVWFTIIFTGLDILQSMTIGRSGFQFSLAAFLRDMVDTFVTTYAFAAPIGAILTTHLLLARRDLVLWVLSGVAIFFIAFGLLGGDLL